MHNSIFFVVIAVILFDNCFYMSFIAMVLGKTINFTKTFSLFHTLKSCDSPTFCGIIPHFFHTFHNVEILAWHVINVDYQPLMHNCYFLARWL